MITNVLILEGIRKYKYDPSGRRIEVRFRDGDIRRYYYDNHDLLAAYDGSNNFLAAAVYGPGIDQAISKFRNGQNYYYHADALGSIYQMTDSAQNIVKDYDYSAFGKIISESGSLPFDNPITYTGREYDSDSGLYYYRARYYDAEVGRFLSRDPVSIELRQLYAYGENNPIRYNDPLGLYHNQGCQAWWDAIERDCPPGNANLVITCQSCCDKQLKGKSCYGKCLGSMGCDGPQKKPKEELVCE